MSAPFLKVKNKNRFGIVPDEILENKNLSFQARLVAAWLAGRSDEFIVRIGSLRRILGLSSDSSWKRVRKELEEVGWWASTKKQEKPGGCLVWSHYFEFFPSSNFPPMGVPSHGNPMDGKREDINTPIGEYQEKFTKKEENNHTEKTETTPPTPSSEQRAGSEKSQSVVFAEVSEEPFENIVARLTVVGVNPKDARSLAEKYSPARIIQVIDYAKSSAPKNPGGFVFKALTEEWDILPEMSDESVSGEVVVVEQERSNSSYKRDLALWSKIPYETKRRCLLRGGYGSNMSYPDPGWLRNILLELKLENRSRGDGVIPGYQAKEG